MQVRARLEDAREEELLQLLVAEVDAQLLEGGGGVRVRVRARVRVRCGPCGGEGAGACSKELNLKFSKPKMSSSPTYLVRESVRHSIRGSVRCSVRGSVRDRARLRVEQPSARQVSGAGGAADVRVDLLDHVVEDVVVDGLDDRVTRGAALLRGELDLDRGTGRVKVRV